MLNRILNQGNATMAFAVRDAMRLKPGALIIGEVRSPDALPALFAANTSPARPA